jgi:transcription-repair coupling factor (superfamily II helicase)
MAQQPDFPVLAYRRGDVSPSIGETWCATRPDVSLIEGLAGSSPSLFIAQAFDAVTAPILVVTSDAKSAASLSEELRSCIGDGAVFELPSRDAVPYNQKSPFGPTVETRYMALSALMAEKHCVIVAPAVTLWQRILEPRRLFNRIVRLNQGDTISQDTLAAWLSEIGFRRETAVEDIGTFAIRGDIFDIYPLLSEQPVRLEFFGDEIESIRRFDIFTQKSKGAVTSIELYPMSEFAFTDTEVAEAIFAMREKFEDDAAYAPLIDRVEHAWTSLAERDGIEWYLNWFNASPDTILNYLPQKGLVIWHDLMPPQRRYAEHLENYQRHYKRLPETIAPLVTPPDALLAGPDEIATVFDTCTRVFIDTTEAPPEAVILDAALMVQPAIVPTVEFLAQEFSTRSDEGYTVTVVCANVGHAERFVELIGERCPYVKVLLGYLAMGFIDKLKQRAVYAEGVLFKRAGRAATRPRIKGGVPIAALDALAPGDYVVHGDHGIGRFTGIECVTSGEYSSDCMVIQYEGASRLYVPVDDFRKVQKYIGRESTAPTLSKLGSPSWERLKTRTREAVHEMASELIALYAKREYLEGIAFGPDTPWQQEFADAFLYDETPDQKKAIDDIRRDMEANKPMDRLICGDVGFGKTEVAMRAIFKAVMAGYQAAILAPTTILAAQHGVTFRSRMADFPVRIVVLSRFQSTREIREAAQRIREGAIDVVIGTHRLLSNDIIFKNLGLLVIDEEQRFGVAAKEKLKQFRSTIDVLSMTATPIPRTMHLSLSGARDMSIIATPPANRLPIETHVREFHEEILRTAIETELDRGGQTFVVHNRIKSLYLLLDRIESLVPRARVSVAHGQMEEHQLEQVMTEFVAGRSDVLLSTDIIENGVDISNVNTIIVNRADLMGLSQLYQLRGRVGRSAEQAYAWFLTPSFAGLQEGTLRRLRALEQYTDLGSGFQIAMRDLEIRGAGNILGTRQHGFIAAVGFEMYCRLLKEAVDELRGLPPESETPDVSVDFRIDAFLPPAYVSDATTRVSLYQELSSAQSPDAVDDVATELADRFGPLPTQASALLDMMRLKVLARKIGIVKVSVSDAQLTMTLSDKNETASQATRMLMKMADRTFEVINGPPVIIKTPLAAPDSRSMLSESIRLCTGALADDSQQSA